MEMTNLMFCVKNGSEFARRKKLMTIRNHFGSFVEIKSPWKTDYHQFNLRKNPISFNLCSGIVFVGKYYLCLRTLFQHAIIIFNSIYVKSKIDFVICQVCWWGQKCGGKLTNWSNIERVWKVLFSCLLATSTRYVSRVCIHLLVA